MQAWLLIIISPPARPHSGRHIIASHEILGVGVTMVNNTKDYENNFGKRRSTREIRDNGPSRPPPDAVIYGTESGRKKHWKFIGARRFVRGCNRSATAKRAAEAIKRGRGRSAVAPSHRPVLVLSRSYNTCIRVHATINATTLVIYENRHKFSQTTFRGCIYLLVYVLLGITGASEGAEETGSSGGRGSKLAHRRKRYLPRVSNPHPPPGSLRDVAVSFLGDKYA